MAQRRQTRHKAEPDERGAVANQVREEAPGQHGARAAQARERLIDAHISPCVALQH